MDSLETLIGTDIYWLDQLMKGRVKKTDRILDAGCGSGRNMRWLATNGYQIVGCDLDDSALEAARLATGLEAVAFEKAEMTKMPYKNGEFDVVICSAVLHFAKSEVHFWDMFDELDRVLNENGILFIRMTGSFGMNEAMISVGEGCFQLPDGTTRFLLTPALVDDIKSRGFELLDPIKSTLVADLRSMTTLVLLKKGE